MMQPRRAKPIAFHLPQFHRIPENDRWWGEGFTEWTLVRGAKPLFAGHEQPVAPHADIGYYDLLDPMVRRRQGEMARAHGIHGFCYYHYWFNGQRLLETPLELMLEDGYPDLPFCLCWANEPWSRRWSGEDRAILQPQNYGEADDWEAHFNLLARFFQHANYLCIEGRPVFLVYRIGHIPNAGAMIEHWRHLALARGLPGLHIVAIEGGFADNRISPQYVDATAEHQPSCVLHSCRPLVTGGLKVASVEEVWRHSLRRAQPLTVCYRGACHAWDNTPRRGSDGYAILPSRPARFRAHLAQLFAMSRSSGNDPLVFLNAFNEWSEGASLEPGQAGGYQWLEAVHAALEDEAPRIVVGASIVSHRTRSEPCSSRLVNRSRPDPDVDLINVLVTHGVKAICVVDFGCSTGASSEHLRNFLGADRYVGLEPDPDRADAAREYIDEVHVIGDLATDLARFTDLEADFVVCNELLGRVADPLATLTGLRGMVSGSGYVCLGFDHAGHHRELIRLLASARPRNGGDGADPPRRFMVDEAKVLVERAGFDVIRIYRVFSSRAPSDQHVRIDGTRVKIDGIGIDGLEPAQIDGLFCVRFYLFAAVPSSGVPVPAETEAPVTRGQSRETLPASSIRFRSRVNTNVSPHDSLYAEYARRDNIEDYFSGAFRQIDFLNTLVSGYRHDGLGGLSSIADYACHYGRLLRALRAVWPDRSLHAYDIDPRAVAFCEANFGVAAEVVGWDPDPASYAPRHQLLICASLLTHTGVEYYRRVLPLWMSLLEPGGLLCFTYLGASYLPKWLRGELDHYGYIDPDERRAGIKAFARDGHLLTGFISPYSSRAEYGVGFMSESVMCSVLDEYPMMEYLDTVVGDNNPFNQDLAVVRKRHAA